MDDTPHSVVIIPGASTDAAGPVNKNPSSAVSQSVDGYNCEFPGCTRVFTTKTGCGVHHRSAHKDWYDARQNVNYSKARWNQEESALLARQEARLILQGVKKVKINQELAKLFPKRTHEAIKGQRRKVQHKNAVIHNIEQTRPKSPLSVGTPPDNSANDSSNEEVKLLVDEYINNLTPCKDDNYNRERLNTICSSLKTWSCDRIFEEISLYMLDTFPVIPTKVKERKQNNSDNKTTLSRRAARKSEYAMVQKAWKKNRSSCMRNLLKDKHTSNTPPKDVMIPFWERIMTSTDTRTPGVERQTDLQTNLWVPITPKEIRAAYPPLGTAAGPDGLSSKDLRAIPIGIITRLFNIFIICGKLPAHLLESRTTLIPKKDGASEPGEFRPITVSSNLTRAFHKILANRMAKYIRIDTRQKAFRPIDGCSENIFLMDFALRYCRKYFKSLFMASLDVAKAFDSVTHEAIIDTLHSYGVPGLMTNYIADTYERSVTRLCCEDWVSHVIHPTCGVKQGDPLSPIIFNLIIDRLFAKLPLEVGLKIGNLNLNAIGFADDLVLFATTELGLQLLLDGSADYLQKCGLSINTSKCFTVTLRTVPKEKKSVVDATMSFTCQKHTIPALKRTDDWKYLGVPFTPEGRLMARPLDTLKKDLHTLTTAPLKPQQRLFILRTVVLPSLYHQLVLGMTNISLLNKLDIAIRMALRKWLNLPHDVPKAYFHADVKDGGLSFPSLRWVIPLQRYHRLRKLKICEDDEVPIAAKVFVEAETSKVEQRLRDQNSIIRSTKEYKTRFAKLLHTSNDGRALRYSRDILDQHRWITDGTLFTSGKDFIQMNKLRINAIPLRTRMARGRPRDRQCRAGCRSGETLHHVLQICHRTHIPRIKRHDACLNYVLKSQDTATTSIFQEPNFRNKNRLLKPDAVIKTENKAIVIDAIIAGDNADLDLVHLAKIDKYSCLEAEVKKRFSVKEAVFTSLTLSSRGIWSKKSCEHLLKLRLIKRKDIKILSTRALIGGLNALSFFNRSTAVRPRCRQG